MNENKTTKERVEEQIARKEREITRLRELLEQFPRLGDLQYDISPWGSTMDFDNLKHPEIIKVISVLGGKWKKEPGDNGRVNYEATINGQRFRCWQGEPPPSCRIIEEEVIVPAQPERRETRRKLVCVDTQPTPTTPEAA